MALVVHSPVSSIMAEHQNTDFELGEMSTNTEGSLRSRASSVISTGTKFSISTMPQGLYHIDGMVEGSNSRDNTTRPGSIYNINGLIEGTSARNAATRPGSIYSMRSIAPSLPPYEGHQPMEASQQTALNDNYDLEQPLTPLDTEIANALSRQYGRVVRTIDENHTRQLERIYRGHEQQLAETRDAIDKAYRAEFKKKDREVERIREEAAAAVATLEDKVNSLKVTHAETIARMQQESLDEAVQIRDVCIREKAKACNAIEDVWEGRWNDRTRLATEEAQRRDLEQEEEWLSILQEKDPIFVDEMKEAIELTRARKRPSS